MTQNTRCKACNCPAYMPRKHRYKIGAMLKYTKHGHPEISDSVPAWRCQRCFNALIRNPPKTHTAQDQVITDLQGPIDTLETSYATPQELVPPTSQDATQSYPDKLAPLFHANLVNLLPLCKNFKCAICGEGVRRKLLWRAKCPTPSCSAIRIICPSCAASKPACYRCAKALPIHTQRGRQASPQADRSHSSHQ